MAAEKNFEEKVKTFLKDRDCWFIKYWGGGQFTKAGVPDLIICVDGNFVAVELKAPKGRPSALQIKCLQDIVHANGIAILLYPKDFDAFKNFIDELKEGVPVDTLIDMYPFVTDWWYRYDI
jgi:hypothetical protein